MKKLVLCLSIFFVFMTMSFAQATQKTFAGNYEIYYQVDDEDPILGSTATFNSDGTFRWVNNGVAVRGTYEFKKISGNSSSNYKYEISLLSDIEEVYELKTTQETIIPGKRNNTSKNSFITTRPIYVNGSTCYVIFIAQ